MRIEGRSQIGWGEVWQATLRLSTLLALILLAFVWTGTYLYLQLDREKSMQGAISNTGNIARMFEEHVARAVKDIDQTLLFLRRSYEAAPDAFDLPAWTNTNYLLNDLILQVSLVGPDGMLTTTNILRNPDKVDLSDREHFRVHANRTTDELYISKPVLGRASGKWSVQLTRRLSRPDGSFDGVLVASLDPFYLSRFFDQIDLGRDGAITLFGADGIVRARGGVDDGSLGQSIRDTRLFEQASTETTGHYHGADPLTGRQQLVSFRRMQDFPLVVAVAMDEAEILADYENTRSFFLWSATGLTAAILLVMGSAIAYAIRLERIRAAHRQSEQQVAAKSAELEATLKHMTQGIVMVSPDGHISVINRRASQLLAHSDDILPGSALPECARIFLTGGQTPPAAGKVVVRETVAADGTMLEILVTSLPDGSLLHTLTDITARKRHEQALAEARDRAEAASRARTAFLATMSHEIRTPLNGVIGMTQLLEGCTDPAEQADYVKTMRESADHLLQIVEDILDVSRLDADRLAFETMPFDVASVINSAADIVAPAARAKALDLAIDMSSDLPERLVGDPRRLRQVLLNLLGNAVKFTDSGRVTVEVACGRSGAGAHDVLLRLKVKDTGIGIAPEHLGQLFQDFSQLDGSVTRRFGGTGLGLAITRRLLERMGGSISVESRPGFGSTFTVLLPLDYDRDRAPPARIEEMAEPAPVVPLPASTTPLRILLAEDDAVNAIVATRMLERLGHQVIRAVDGVEAVETLRRNIFDLVLMDMMMPRMDGLTATRVIRSSGEAFADIPIVALTADVLAEDRDRAVSAGMDGFAAKPVERDRLDETIRMVMAKVRRAGDRRSHGPEESERPVLDRTVLDRLRAEIGDDSARVVTDLFVGETVERIATLRRLDLDRPTAAREFHSLKSSALTFGLARLSALCSRLQDEALRLDDAGLQHALDDLTAAFDEARAEIATVWPTDEDRLAS